jgi:hypothetical protein
MTFSFLLFLNEMYTTVITYGRVVPSLCQCRLLIARITIEALEA